MKMQVSIEAIAQIVGFVGTLMWISYRVGKLEMSISQQIKSVETQLHLHISRYDGDKNLQDHMVKTAYDRINHVGSNLKESQREIQRFLADNQGFVIRERDLE